jgi:hypothetical protein
MVKRKRKSGLSHGFVSKAQQRFFFAKGKTDPKFAKLARKHAVRNPRFKTLPIRKGRPTARTGRKVR